MPVRKADDPLIVQVPTAAQDRPPWRTVGIIAAVGFIVGIAWPRFAGVRLGPSLPDAPSASAAPTIPVAAAPTPPQIAASRVAPSSSVPTTLAATASAPATAHASERPPAVSSATSPTHTSEHLTPVDAAPSIHTSAGAADGTAQVVWETALIRDAPKTGKIVARLPRGTTIRVGPPIKDGWYPVKPGEGFTGEGWVFRGAIGR
jgi:hypothetical protein